MSIDYPFNTTNLLPATAYHNQLMREIDGKAIGHDDNLVWDAEVNRM